MTAQGGTGDGQLVPFLRKRDYKFIRELGHGACGRTVLLHDGDIDEYFVCKKYSPTFESAQIDLFANFVREIKLLHKVNHPNIVRAYGYYLYRDQRAGYILMEFIDGVDIETYVARNPECLSEIFIQALSGFAYLESAAILHRDIRPGNIMVTNDGSLKIIDLGFGKHAIGSQDFDKSISLNWWCEKPDDFRDSRYDFSTEVYFVGKLFEKVIQETGIENFQYSRVLREMCQRDPEHRTSSFATALQHIRSRELPAIGFTEEEIGVYRVFANQLCLQLSKFDRGVKYLDDIIKIERSLTAAFQQFMLEDEVPDCVVVTRCFLDGSYYYRKQGLSVEPVKRFLELFRSCGIDRAKVLLANLHGRFDVIERENPSDPDIPF